jgi:hypothetical protein
MGQVEPFRKPGGEAAGLHDHALENIRFIRSTMERAGAFTAVPGLGGAFMGATALAAAWMARQQSGKAEWLSVWMIEMVIAVAIGALAMVHKARKIGVPLIAEPGRKFAMSFAPAVFAGALLTPVLYEAGLLQVLAASWLLLYGVAVIAAGAFSVRIVPAMGAAFIAMGAVALQTPMELRDLPLAAGFGGLHIVFGFWIYRRYGG